MEESLHQLWNLVIWYFGINTTVGLFLIRWLFSIQSKLDIGKDITYNLSKVVEDLDEIKVALKGDYEHPGLVTKHYDLEKRVHSLEESN